ncbi:MAG: helix-turn-helix domain protein [Rhodocyclales bacterium]|nr:helix-turn-helix domain protein [Rhodocyclales bacterium]
MHTTEHFKPFGRFLKTLREGKGYSQKYVALSTGIDQSVIAGMESGRRPPPRNALLTKLLVGLGASDAEIAAARAAVLQTRIARLVAAETQEIMDSNHESSLPGCVENAVLTAQSAVGLSILDSATRTAMHVILAKLAMAAKGENNM